MLVVLADDFSGAAEIAGIAFIRAVGAVRGLGEMGHLGVAARDVLHDRIARFLQAQGVGAVGDDLAAEADNDAALGGRDGNRMIGAGNLGGFIHGYMLLKKGRHSRLNIGL